MVYVLPTVESLGMILKFYPLEFRCDWSFLHLVIPRLLGILCKIDVFFFQNLIKLRYGYLANRSKALTKRKTIRVGVNDISCVIKNCLE